MWPAALIALSVLAQALQAQTAPGQSLKIVHPVISQSEDGPPLETGLSFQPGDIAWFSFQVENYKTSPTGKVQLTGHTAVFDSSGKAIIPRDEEVIGTTLSQEDKDWKPKLRLQIQLPSIAPPGDYRIKFDVADLQTHRTASSELSFPVTGRNVEPANILTVRNLGFYRTQDEESPLKLAAYRAGDMLWVRFDMTGYKYGAENSIDATYDVAVFTAEGKQLFAQEDAAVEKSQAFYPQPWVPAVFNLSLQPTMRAGTYSLVITAHDGIGGQTATAKAEFRVE